MAGYLFDRPLIKPSAASFGRDLTGRKRAAGPPGVRPQAGEGSIVPPLLHCQGYYQPYGGFLLESIASGGEGITNGGRFPFDIAMHVK